MTIRRLQAAPKQWVQQFESTVQRWLERVSLYILVTGRVDVALDPASVSANTTNEEEFTVTGARTGDGVIVTKPTETAGLVIGNARVSDTDKVSITFGNLTGSPIDPPSETYRIYLLRWKEG